MGNLYITPQPQKFPTLKDFYDKIASVINNYEFWIFYNGIYQYLENLCIINMFK